MLATLTFDAIAEGLTDISLSVTLGDLTEGVALVGPPGSFAPVTFNNSSMSVVPEPSILALMGAGLAGIGFVRRRKPQA